MLFFYLSLNKEELWCQYYHEMIGKDDMQMDDNMRLSMEHKLKQEWEQQEKYKEFAQQMEDDQLKSKFIQIADKHQQAYEKLLGYLQ